MATSIASSVRGQFEQTSLKYVTDLKFRNLQKTNINIQYDINPENIVAIIFVLKYPTIIAIIAAYIFGSVNSIKFP